MDQKDAKKIIKAIEKRVKDVLEMSTDEIVKAYEKAGGSLTVDFSATLRGNSAVVDGKVKISFVLDKHKIEKAYHVDLKQLPLPLDAKETPAQKKAREKEEKKSKKGKEKQEAIKDLVKERKKKPGESDAQHKKRNKEIDKRLAKEKAASKKGKDKPVNGKVVPLNQNQTAAGSTAIN